MSNPQKYDSLASLRALEAILNGLDDYIYVSDSETDKILFINDHMREHFNLNEDVTGSVCWRILQKNFEERCSFCPIPQLLQNPEKPVVWEEYNSVTGRYYQNVDRIIEWVNGEKVHLQHSTDITASKLAEFELKKQLKQQSLMSSISQSFVSVEDKDVLIERALRMAGEFMDVNQAFLSRYHKDEGVLECIHEWCSEGVESFVHGSNRWPISPDMRIYRELMNDGYSVIKDFSKETHPNFQVVKDYNIGSFLNITVEVRGEFWGILGFTLSGGMREWHESDVHLGKLIAGVFSGVISRELTDKELFWAKEAAEQASKSKSDFLSRMSHEIRTPMNAIIGMTGIARNSQDSAKIIYCLEKIDKASKHLLGIINDILDMSKIEADKFELSQVEFDFEKVLMDIAGVVNYQAEEKKQNLLVDFDTSIPSTLIGDEMRLSQVLTNLLTNAIKFTPEGGTIKLSVQKSGERSGVSQLRFMVEDNGIGISKEQQSRLFTSFEQADGGIARKYGGTGLGLAICKKIVEKMDGKIWVDSELGKGSRFIFEIEVQNGRLKTKNKAEKILKKKDVRVLAVDDAPEIREYFSHVLPSLGFHCEVAESGLAALRMIEQSADNPFNIFFVDWMMPGLNGIELTRLIKRVTHENAVIIMISVSDWSTIEKEALSTGVDRFISKPLFPSTILDAIYEAAGFNTKTMVAQGKDCEYDFRNYNLLLVEDVEINREIIATLLEESKINIDYAANGRKAVEMFSQNPGKYSVILMDIYMPEMNGYEATVAIRALDTPQSKKVPIIAMTANVFREDIEKCLGVGMNDHIGKPVDMDELLEKLNKHLPFIPSLPAHEEAPPEEERIPLNYSEFLPILDIKGGLARVMNNKKLYFRLIESFSSRQLTDNLADSIANGNFLQIQQAAHALKGVAANLGFEELRKMALEIETRAKNSINVDNLSPRLEQTVEDSLSAIERLLHNGKA